MATQQCPGLALSSVQAFPKATCSSEAYKLIAAATICGLSRAKFNMGGM
jgi:hypothetical protein